MGKHRLTDKEIRAQVRTGRDRAAVARASEPRAKAARYDLTRDMVIVELTNGVFFEFPARLGQGLRDAAPEQLVEVEVSPSGEALRWERLDVDLRVAALLQGVFGTKTWMRELGRAGGRVRSDAKIRAARRNGAKGGRPRKSPISSSIGQSSGANPEARPADLQGASSGAAREAAAPEISAQDLAQVEWQDALSGKAPVLGRGRPCYELADSTSASGDSRAALVFEALGHGCSLVLRLDEPTAPFVSSVVMGQSHSASINQISEGTARAFGSAAATVRDVALRARLGDIAWVRVRDHQAARTALQAYVDLADKYSGPDQWPEMVIQLERALQLAMHLGRKADLTSAVRNKIQALLDGSSLDGDGFRAARLLHLLLRYGSDDPGALSTKAVGFAEKAMGSGEYARAREYWELAADFASAAKDHDRRRELLTHLAETFVAEAKSALCQPRVGPLLAAGLITKAIEVLRRIGGAKVRINELHTWLIEVQRDVPDQLLPIGSTIDLTNVAEAAEQLVSGRTPELALLQLALLPVTQDVGHLRERVEKQAKDFLLMSLFPKQAIDIDGKVIARQPSVGSSNPEERELAIRIEMISQTSLQYQAVGQGVVRPARDAIMREHDLRAMDLLGITAHNPLVPAGREMLVAEGLHAGFSCKRPLTTLWSTAPLGTSSAQERARQ